MAEKNDTNRAVAPDEAAVGFEHVARLDEKLSLAKGHLDSAAEVGANLAGGLEKLLAEAGPASGPAGVATMAFMRSLNAELERARELVDEAFEEAHSAPKSLRDMLDSMETMHGELLEAQTRNAELASRVEEIDGRLRAIKISLPSGE